jgi:hypothetical protein
MANQKHVIDVKLGKDEVKKWVSKLNDIDEGMERADLEYEGGKVIIHRKD